MATTAERTPTLAPSPRPQGPTLGQWTATFVPFGLLLSAALLGAEIGQNLLMTRVRTSSWVALAFYTAAACLYFWPGESPRRKNLWLLLWTFAFVGYLVHFGYSVFGVYHGSLREVFAGQRWYIAGSNFLVTFWWAADVAHAWLRRQGRWQSVLRTISHLLVFTIFFVSSVVIFGGVVRILGIVMTASVLVCLLVRLVRKLSHRPA